MFDTIWSLISASSSSWWCLNQVSRFCFTFSIEANCYCWAVRRQECDVAKCGSSSRNVTTDHLLYHSHVILCGINWVRKRMTNNGRRKLTGPEPLQGCLNKTRLWSIFSPAIHCLISWGHTQELQRISSSWSVAGLHHSMQVYWS